jgi:hypothetical protein
VSIRTSTKPTLLNSKQFLSGVMMDLVEAGLHKLKEQQMIRVRETRGRIKKENRARNDFKIETQIEFLKSWLGLKLL